MEEDLTWRAARSPSSSRPYGATHHNVCRTCPPLLPSLCCEARLSTRRRGGECESCGITHTLSHTHVVARCAKPTETRRQQETARRGHRSHDDVFTFTYATLLLASAHPPRHTVLKCRTTHRPCPPHTSPASVEFMATGNMQRMHAARESARKE